MLQAATLVLALLLVVLLVLVLCLLLLPLLLLMLLPWLARVCAGAVGAAECLTRGCAAVECVCCVCVTGHQSLFNP